MFYTNNSTQLKSLVEITEKTKSPTHILLTKIKFRH